jgi:hypothetical protein
MSGAWFIGWTLFVSVCSFFLGCWAMIDHYEKEKRNR